jgi:hypothetical protein
MWNLLPVAVGNLLQRPRFDRVFYVPLWECPYECADCCVDSLPGAPPEDVTRGVPTLLALTEAIAARRGAPIGVHVYGGEPLLRADAIEELVRTLDPLRDVARIYLYTTLRSHAYEKIARAAKPGRLRFIVNPATATDEVRARVASLGASAEWYRNVTIFPTGRGRVGSPAYRRSLLERVVPASAPGRSCFATVSGPLVNGPHGVVHLCCLPQSPVIGRLDEPAPALLARYEELLVTHHARMRAEAERLGVSHACAVCEHESAWSPRRKPEELIHVRRKLRDQVPSEHS